MTTKWFKFPVHTVKTMVKNGWASINHDGIERGGEMFFAIMIPFKRESFIELDVEGKPDLRWLQSHVGGYIEPLPGVVGVNISDEIGVENAYIKKAYVDEEGPIKNKQLNLIGSGLAGYAIKGDLLLEVEINE